MNLWSISIYPVFTPHAREAVRSPGQLPQEPVISLVYIKKLSPSNCSLQGPAPAQNSRKGSLVILPWIPLSLNNCFEPLGLKEEEKEGRICIMLFFFFFLKKAESIPGLSHSLIWSYADSEACNFLFRVNSQPRISRVSVGPAILWYLEGPLEIWWFHLKVNVVSGSGLLGKPRGTAPRGSQRSCTHRRAWPFAVIRQGCCLH